LYVALDSPIAREGIERIGELYAIEREIRGLSPDERRYERQRRAAPLLESLHAWLLSQLAQLFQASALAKAISYAVKPAHWPALAYYCTMGRLRSTTTRRNARCARWPWEDEVICSQAPMSAANEPLRCTA
jgi:hypothetical protein